MSYNGSGTFQINTSGQPVVTGTIISSTAFNSLTADLATGLSTAITKDGQTATTVRIPFAQGISSTLATDSTSTGTGSIITAGGVGIAKALYVGTTSNLAGASTFGAAVTFNSTISYGGVTLTAAVTGTGAMVLNTSPTLVTPTLGVASATSFTLTGTGASKLNVGTTGDRPTAATGLVRYNTTTSRFEGYGASAWGALGGGATGGGTDQIFIENGQTVNTDYTITASNNAGTFGPITVATGVTVTVPTGSVWSIV
jgi:hypothetical protein